MRPLNNAPTACVESSNNKSPMSPKPPTAFRHSLLHVPLLALLPPTQANQVVATTLCPIHHNNATLRSTPLANMPACHGAHPMRTPTPQASRPSPHASPLLHSSPSSPNLTRQVSQPCVRLDPPTPTRHVPTHPNPLLIVLMQFCAVSPCSSFESHF